MASHSPRTLERVSMKPFVVADSALPLEPTCIKCYEIGQPPYRRSFNYSLISTRIVVEQAFSSLKGPWKTMDGRFMPGMWLWFAVDNTMSMKGINVHLRLAGFEKKVLTLKPCQLICK